MATIQLPPDFREFLRLLNSYQVEYLLIGGWAVGYYGYVRPTNDLDVWVALEPHNAERVAAVLKEFGFNVPELSPELFLKENQVIRMGVPPVRVEILTTASGVSFGECYVSRVQEAFEGVAVNLISLRHLKINKRASGSLKDLNDLEHLP
jgi:hypothetical protein